MQKFLNDSAENKFINVWLAFYAQTMSDLQDYFNLVYESNTMGALLFDNQFAEIAKIISRDLFIKTYWQIFREQQKNGTIDAHLYILYAIFGADSTIFVETPNPLHIKFNIITNFVNLSQWVTRLNDIMVTRGGDNLVFRNIILSLSNQELTSLLKATSNYGEYLEFDISLDPVDNFDYGMVSENVITRLDYGRVTEQTDLYADYGLVTDITNGG